MIRDILLTSAAGEERQRSIKSWGMSCGTQAESFSCWTLFLMDTMSANIVRPVSTWR